MYCTINFVNNPVKFYTPGESVELVVELVVTEVYDVDEIYLYFSGTAACQFLSKSSQKLLSGHVNYLNKKLSILNQTTLQPGTYRFNPNFHLPADLPSSMDSIDGYWKKACGSIAYKIELHITSSTRSALKFESPFTVMCPLDLNEIAPILQVPMTREAFKSFSFDFSPKELYVEATIEQQGFVPGEDIGVTVNVHNLTRIKIHCVTVSLNRVLVLTSLNPTVEVVRMEIVESLETCGQVKPNSHRVFTKSLRVPALMPNIDNCEVIRVAYEVCVKAKANGLHRSVQLTLPVLIGTSRLANLRDDRRNSSSSYGTKIL